ncbi:hypothetical protein H7F10_07005 [Acidithiobacillus sp. HP-6]|uniref:hypothetical protein n=1 Tax=unclassified Acidithiobacillus TaxID=2614800 RepID=UPI00187A9911|nr:MULTISPECIES: hypothetical protein [unclassified Acidithiobacillus]MBE7562703.1 hypothetical protein [Acidithiobacillus sp. HP-6]MBE7570501.1 hypothetical protein [Acidithiobacillus sp. HP-2]
MNFNFNHRLREDIIRTFNVLAYAGGITQLGALAYNLFEHDKGMSGFLAAIGYILVCKSIVWLVMACED